MAGMARSAVIALLSVGLLAGRAAPPSPAINPPLTLVASDGGDLAIGNGPLSTTIDSLVHVERWGAEGWRPVSATLHAVAACADPSTPYPATVTLRPREERKIVGWTGYSCASQCVRSCGFNVYWGEGRYRFGATVRPRGDLIVSNVFTMPRRPPPPRKAPFTGDNLVQRYIDYAEHARVHPQ